MKNMTTIEPTIKDGVASVTKFTYEASVAVSPVDASSSPSAFGE